MNTREARAGFCKSHGYHANLCLDMFGCTKEFDRASPECFDLRKVLRVHPEPDEKQADDWMKACVKRPVSQQTEQCRKFHHCYSVRRGSEGECLYAAGVIFLEVAGYEFEFRD